IATDRAGVWVAFWGASDSNGGGANSVLQVAVSDSGPTAFGPPAPLYGEAAADDAPHIASNGAGVWIAVWQSANPLDGSVGPDFDILFARSTNNGATWNAPEPLNSNAAADSGGDFSPCVATDGAGNWLVAWHSTDDLDGSIGSDFDILFARSTDNGATWSDAAPLDPKAADDAGGDFNPQLGTDRAGNWVAVWQSSDTLDGVI